MKRRPNLSPTNPVTSDPIEFLKETIPALLNEPLEEVRAAAAKGDAEAKKKVDELQASAPLAVRWRKAAGAIGSVRWSR